MIVIGSLIFLLSCVGLVDLYKNNEEDAQANVIPTFTPTPQETNTPPATNTPTQTPSPTTSPTVAPTNTPEPTHTPIPTQEFSGVGSAVVGLNPAGFASVACISGNQSARHFAVKSIDSNNETVDLLVNTTDPYNGCCPLDWLQEEQSVRLSIDAVGEWTITIYPVEASTTFIERFGAEVPGTFHGDSDTILVLSGSSDPDIAKITANSDARHFAVIAWTPNDRNLLVNTTDPYNGTVILDRDTTFLEIDAESPWEITVETQ